VLVNVCLTSQNTDVQVTVGRATTSGALAATSTNIVSGISPLTLPNVTPNYYMAALGKQGDLDGEYYNLTGSALDFPAASNTYYYTVWMSSVGSKTFNEMAVSLQVLQVLA
jgi:hypothetical protein